MEAYLVEVAKTNSPTLLICGGLIGLVYYLIKAQREKTAAKRDSEKKDTDLQLALQAKDIENLKTQVAMQSSRWDTLQDTLGKMNENLAAIRENISNLDQRIDRLENR
jgi:peptidoglycan hydrolase CwlO-like protein